MRKDSLWILEFKRMAHIQLLTLYRLLDVSYLRHFKSGFITCPLSSTCSSVVHLLPSRCSSRRPRGHLWPLPLPVIVKSITRFYWVHLQTPQARLLLLNFPGAALVQAKATSHQRSNLRTGLPVSTLARLQIFLHTAAKIRAGCKCGIIPS